MCSWCCPLAAISICFPLAFAMNFNSGSWFCRFNSALYIVIYVSFIISCFDSTRGIAFMCENQSIPFIRNIAWVTLCSLVLVDMGSMLWTTISFHAWSGPAMYSQISLSELTCWGSASFQWILQAMHLLLIQVGHILDLSSSLCDVKSYLWVTSMFWNPRQRLNKGAVLLSELLKPSPVWH